ncbi:acyltransferase family protein [Puia sp. P3]|uniref:acyltransferase family protein n=1 Tax=Puia sp. P3 TaxID=3423952 RepID=UPI003D6706CD
MVLFHAPNEGRTGRLFPAAVRHQPRRLLLCIPYCKVARKGGNAWLSWLGKYSLYIYILHVPIAAIVRNLASHSGIVFNSWVLIFTCWGLGVTVPILLYQLLTRFGFGKLFSLKNKPAA